MSETKSALKVLEELGIAAESSARTAIDEAARGERSDFVLKIPTEQRFGFGIPTRTLEQVADEHREKLQQTEKGADTFRSKLMLAGIPPAAVLPTKLWNAFTKKFHILRFEGISSNGFVASNLSKMVENFEIFQACCVLAILPTIFGLGFAVPWLGLLFGVSTVSLFLSITCGIEKDNPLACLLLFLLCIAAFFGGPILESNGYSYLSVLGMHFVGFVLQAIMIFGFIGLSEGTGWSKFETRLLLLIFKVLPKRLKCKLLWPDGTDRFSDDEKVTKNLVVSFPTPPKAFVEMLNNIVAAGFQPCIAADCRAVKIDTDSVQRSIEERLRHDPICYIVSEDGQYAAIFSQFGEFASEKKAMKWAINEGKEVFLK